MSPTLNSEIVTDNLLTELQTPSATEPSKVQTKTSRYNLTQYYGFSWGLLSSLFLATSNTLIKKAHITTGPEQAFARYAVQATIMSIILLVFKLDFFGPKKARKLLMVRGCCGAVGLLSLYSSVKLINPSDAVALLHLNSVITTIIARIFLKEKMSFAHLTCLLTCVVGVVFIAQPSFIFEDSLSIVELNRTTVENASVVLNKHLLPPSDRNFLIGVFLAILTATLSAIVAVVLKKLSDEKVHYAVPTIYASYFGVPTSLLISSVMLATGLSEKDPAILDDIPSFSLQVIYSLSCALCGTASQVTMNWALNYEEAGKISIIRSTDLFFTYVFQYLWLGISTNWFSGIGAILIISGTFMILIYKIVDKKMSANTEKHSFFVRILLFKF